MRHAEPVTPTTLRREYEEIIASGEETYATDPAALEGSATKLKLEGDELFARGDHVSRYRMAFRYLAAAHFYGLLAEHSTTHKEKISLLERAGDLNHFAAHSFRKEEEFRWAGDAYRASGDAFRDASRLLRRSPQKKELIRTIASAIRAYGRAKGTYGAVGDFDLSGKSYLSEQRLTQKLLLKTDLKRGIAFAVWGLFTGYGESVGRWACAYLLGVAAFALANRAAGLTLWDSFAVSGERSLLIPGPDANRLLLFLQFAYTYFNLGLGLSLIVRKMASRG